MEQQFFSLIIRDEDVWKKSSSGGAFTAITDAWMSLHKDKAVIYGCVLDNELKAVHARATDAEGRNRMRGSKYVLSDTFGIYRQVAEDISAGNYVLFSGTPCQIAALKKYLNNKNISFTEQLLTVDVICHGVGSNKYFEDYILDLEKKYKSKAISCSFRGKSRPDKIQEMYVTFENGKKYISAAGSCDSFFIAYHRGLIIRKSCFSCPYAKTQREADLSIADHWGANEGKARSAVIVSSEQGALLLQSTLPHVEYISVEQDDVLQPNMQAPTKKPKNYEEFWDAYLRGGYLAAQRFMGNLSFKHRAKTAAARIAYVTHLSGIIKKIKR